MTTPIPRWGRITAEPHEFLVLIRNGRVHKAGQGLSVWKWPSDSAALIPTSIRKLSFKADQVTVEKAGVEVSGLAVYRVAEPLLAYRMLDGETSGLGDILRDMFIGATRRIVASLTLEECITHRKERVASALMDEIAPVLAGEGRPDDTTDAGWGVVLDTIEIQDVRVLSTDVFARLQAPYREKLALSALVAKDAVTRETARLEVLERAHRDQMLEQELLAELARKQQVVAAERERANIVLETRRIEGALEAELVRMQREACGDLSEARLRELTLERTVPEVAKAFAGAVEHLHITTSDANVARILDAAAGALATVGRSRAD